MAYTYLVPIWVIIWQLVLVADLPPRMVFLGVMIIVMALIAMLREAG